MDTSENLVALNRVAIPASMAAMLVLVVAWPVFRLHRRTGIWAIVRPRRTGAERVVYAGLLLVFALIAGWTAVYSLRGASAAGVVNTPAWVGGLGWGAIASALALLILAQAQMGSSWRIGIDPAPTELVTDGLYRRVRNPIYSAMLLLVVGLVAIAPSVVTGSIVVLATILIAVQARLEERHLLSVHGAAYRVYASRVGRFVPGLGTLAAR